MTTYEKTWFKLSPTADGRFQFEDDANNIIFQPQETRTDQYVKVGRWYVNGTEFNVYENVKDGRTSLWGTIEKWSKYFNLYKKADITGWVFYDAAVVDKIVTEDELVDGGDFTNVVDWQTVTAEEANQIAPEKDTSLPF